jgi:hypothetical protein
LGSFPRHGIAPPREEEINCGIELGASRPVHRFSNDENLTPQSYPFSDDATD